MNIQGWFPFRWLIWYPCSPRDSEESSPRLQFKSINSSVLSLLFGPALKTILDYRKALTLTIQSFVGKVMSLLFNILFRSFIAFLPRSKHLLVSWLQSPSAASFIVQLSHLYMTTGKTIALTRLTFVGKVMSLLFIFIFLFIYFSPSNGCWIYLLDQ